MASVVLYFQVHQPRRLRKYTVFDEDPDYFATAENRRILRKVAEKCYRPATKLMLDLVRRHEGRFRVAYSISGSALDQMQAWTPDVLDLFRELIDTGCCELLAETHDHSLASLYSRDEFRAQVDLHAEKVGSYFGVTPRVFRNTELIYNNDLASLARSMEDASGAPRFDGMLMEGADSLLGRRSPNHLYRPAAPSEGPTLQPTRAFGLLLRHYRLSDDIAFRFSDFHRIGRPLTAETFAAWVDQITGPGSVCNLFMDYETFGEHQWAETGIFRFLDALPETLLEVGRGRNAFLTPSEALASFEPEDEIDCPAWCSWADAERDVSAWVGNAMQENALTELYRFEARLKNLVARSDGRGGRDERRSDAEQLLADWRALTTSDHFYYMSTKHFDDGAVHTYFSPYGSPYDSYINFMNVLDNLRQRVETLEAASPVVVTRAGAEAAAKAATGPAPQSGDQRKS